MNKADLQPGLIPGSVLMSNEEYHGDVTRISKSGIVKLATSPAHYYAKYLDPNKEAEKSTPAKETGKIIHAAILEAEDFDNQFLVVPEDAPKMPTSAQRNAKKPSDETLKQIEWWDNFNAKIGLRQLCSRDDWELAKRIQDSVFKHPSARQLFARGVSEQTFLFEDEDTGAPCKIRPDFIVTDMDDLFVDLKTTIDASFGGFGREAAKYKYDIQDALYEDGFKAATGRRPSGFVFVAVEKEPPYAVACYNADSRTYHSGRVQYKKHLATYMRCKRDNVWPCYSDQVLPLHLPDYYVDRNMKENFEIQEF